MFSALLYNLNMKLLDALKKSSAFQSTELKTAYYELNEINELQEEFKKLTDEELKNKTVEFKERIKNGETLEDIKVEAFATAREATFRVLGKRPFDVQMLGGLVLNKGSVAEMKTGEGKTLTSIAPVYLNALSGEGVLVVTVNEYLTERDALEMGEVHHWLGLTVGINKREISPSQKREAYACDITYSVHAEIGFDYLRDNMVSTLAEKVQRKFNYALIDEVDSILIDEARTPLIISGGSSIPSQVYAQVDFFAKTLKKEEYEIDWESKSINLTNAGIDKANKYFNISNFYDVQNSELVHRVSNALRAVHLMFKDADYIVRDNKIEIVDSFTGRIMEGRSFSEGLHQAIQAKEMVKITEENATLATITYQNLFRMFKKLSGMSGTAKTEEDEFIEIYNMRVNSIPTNKPIQRIDHPDVIYVSAQSKYKAVVEEVKRVHKKGQPILIGTEDVSESEAISEMLTRENVGHTVLNAKQNASEAEMVASAGQLNAVMIATNMAGRGTDIKPSKEALAAGGLFVIGTNKSESRRIDNQLKGRSGRQGDVGESKFFLSLDDKLISRFSNSDKLKKSFEKFGDSPITGKSIIKAVNRAQVKIEGFNFDSRKNVLQYDDIIRQQRDLMYAQRDMIIGNDDLLIVIQRMTKSVIRDLINLPRFSSFRNEDGSIDTEKFANILNSLWFTFTEFKFAPEQLKGKSNEELIEIVSKDTLEVYDQMRQNIIDNIGELGLHDIERQKILTTFDKNWQLHIDKMSKLKSSTSLASYAQKNPFQVYIEKGAEFFEDLLLRISHNAVKILFANSYAMKREKPVEQMVQSFIEEKLKLEAQHNAELQAEVAKQEEIHPDTEQIPVIEISEHEISKEVKEAEKSSEENSAK